MTGSARGRVLGVLVLFAADGPPGALAQEAADPTAAPDTAAATATGAARDTLGAAAIAPADTAAPADTTARAEPAYIPSPAFEALSLFRPERTADVERVVFRDRADAVEPPGLVTLANQLRLSPAVRTRELTQGPAAESVDLSGAGSDRTALVHRGSSFAPPGTSGPHTHEILLSEIDGFAVVRGDAAAIYGPDAVGGAVITLPRHPIPSQLTARVTAEEGVDDWQRGTFQIARRAGDAGAFFGSAESRRIEGFFPGTKQVDRHFAATYVGRARDLEGSLGYRRYEGDGRHGGFDADSIRSVLTKRDDLFLKLFRSTGAGGALLEAEFVHEKLETGVGGPEPRTREYFMPGLRLTADMPGFLGLRGLVRAEASRVEIDREEEGTRRFARAATVARATAERGASYASATARMDLEEGRPASFHVRAEGEWARGGLVAFGILARGERLPDRDAARADDPEVHSSLEAGARLTTGPIRWRGAVFARDIDDLRREPTFEELRAREPVLDAPEGDARIRGASIGAETDLFAFPGAASLGDLRLRTSGTQLSAENTTTDTRLPRRPKRTWTGEGSIEKRFFAGELLARIGGRLMHLGDRVDAAGAGVPDAWVTDVLLEGEVGDAVFFYRFHDLLERADEVEPGIRLPGFSRMWGVTWRFEG